MFWEDPVPGRARVPTSAPSPPAPWKDPGRVDPGRTPVPALPRFSSLPLEETEGSQGQLTPSMTREMGSPFIKQEIEALVCKRKSQCWPQKQQA